LKTQIVVDKANRRIICTAFAKGKTHDFRLFKESKTRIRPEIVSMTDTGYLGMAKLHANCVLPKKRSRKKTLTKDEKAANRAISSARAPNENVIGSIKRFRIIADKYRNRRRRFGLRFNLIAGIYNYELL